MRKAPTAGPVMRSASDRSAIRRSGIGWSRTAAKLVLEPIHAAAVGAGESLPT
jgi:hypothetical protein